MRFLAFILSFLAFYIFSPTTSFSKNNLNIFVVPQYGKCDRSPVTLVRNPQATNHTWSETIQFLEKDQTEQRTYTPNVYTCGHFAEDLYNRAQQAGYRCAFVVIDFKGQEIGHAINAFETTDKGLIYIDATGILNSDQKLPAIKSVGYLFKDKVYFSVPLSAKIARDYPSDYSAGQFYFKQQQELKEQSERFQNNQNQYNKIVEEFNARQTDLNQRKQQWQARHNILTQKRISQRESDDLQRDFKSLNDEQTRLDRDRSSLQAEQANLQTAHQRLSKQNELLKWYNRTTPNPVSDIKIYW